MLAQQTLEPAFAALALTLPSEADIARDIGKRRRSRRDLSRTHGVARRRRRGTRRRALQLTYRRMTSSQPYSPDAASAGRRALRNCCLDLLVASGDKAARALAVEQFTVADNMTDRLAALATLSLQDVPERDQAFEAFYARHQSDALVIDKWLSLQAAIPEARNARSRALAHLPQGVLVWQSEPRAQPDRFLCADQPDAVQPCRRSRLRLRGRLRARARPQKPAGRSPPDDGVSQLARARAGATCARPKRPCGASPGTPGCRATFATSWIARWRLVERIPPPNGGD